MGKKKRGRETETEERGAGSPDEKGEGKVGGRETGETETKGDA